MSIQLCAYSSWKQFGNFPFRADFVYTEGANTLYGLDYCAIMSTVVCRRCGDEGRSQSSNLPLTFFFQSDPTNSKSKPEKQQNQQWRNLRAFRCRASFCSWRHVCYCLLFGCASGSAWCQKFRQQCGLVSSVCAERVAIGHRRVDRHHNNSVLCCLGSQRLLRGLFVGSNLTIVSAFPSPMP